MDPQQAQPQAAPPDPQLTAQHKGSVLGTLHGIGALLNGDPQPLMQHIGAPTGSPQWQPQVAVQSTPMPSPTDVGPISDEARAREQQREQLVQERLKPKPGDMQDDFNTAHPNFPFSYEQINNPRFPLWDLNSATPSPGMQQYPGAKLIVPTTHDYTHPKTSRSHGINHLDLSLQQAPGGMVARGGDDPSLPAASGQYVRDKMAAEGQRHMTPDEAARYDDTRGRNRFPSGTTAVDVMSPTGNDNLKAHYAGPVANPNALQREHYINNLHQPNLPSPNITSDGYVPKPGAPGYAKPLEDQHSQEYNNHTGGTPLDKALYSQEWARGALSPNGFLGPQPGFGVDKADQAREYYQQAHAQDAARQKAQLMETRLKPKPGDIPFTPAGTGPTPPEVNRKNVENKFAGANNLGPRGRALKGFPPEPGEPQTKELSPRQSTR